MRVRAIYHDVLADIGLSRHVSTPLFPMAVAHRMQTVNLVPCFSHHQSQSFPTRFPRGNSTMVERRGRSRTRQVIGGERKGVSVGKPVTTLKY